MPNTVERRRLPRVAAKWPVTIMSEDGPVEGETQNITSEGVFIHCSEKLRQGDIYRIAIKPPKGPIQVAGKLVWSNLDNLGNRDAVLGMGFYFVKVTDEDRQLLSEAISAYKEPG